jgi:hypothetical protein
MRVKGYSLPKIDDKSELHMITDFEKKLPLAMIDLDDFERRLKKLADKDNKDLISKHQIIEVFKDHYATEDIQNPYSLSSELLINDVFRKPGTEEGLYYIPYLLLLGVLYCPSNPELKAKKFYELC